MRGRQNLGAGYLENAGWRVCYLGRNGKLAINAQNKKEVLEMYDYTKEYILERIKQIKNARLTPEHKEKKLNDIKNALFGYFQGNITEEELLWLCA